MGVFIRNPYLIIILPIALMFCCDGTRTRTFAKLIVSEELDSCPLHEICQIPLPLLPKDISACVNDNNCFSGHKCCHTPCYGYKVCQVAIRTTNIHENEKELKDKHSQVVEHTIEKIFKDVLDNLNTEKSFPIKVEKQDDKFSHVKVNLIYNVVKKTYIHNMNVYNPVKTHNNEEFENRIEISKDESKLENPETKIDVNLIFENFSEVENPENHITISEITSPAPTAEIFTTETVNEVIPEKIEIKIEENVVSDTTEENKPETEIIIKKIDTVNHEAGPAEIESKIKEITISETSNTPEKIALTIPEIDITVKCGPDDEDCINIDVGSGIQDPDENDLETSMK